MTDVRGLAVQAVAAKAMLDMAKTYSDGVKTELAGALDAGDRKTATLANGTKCGTVSYANGRATARVTDEQALQHWVADNHPGELVTTVRPAFVTALLEQAKKTGAAVSQDTGELIPGIDVAAGSPYLSVRVDPDALPALADAIRAGQLLALESGEQVTPE